MMKKIFIISVCIFFVLRFIGCGLEKQDDIHIVYSKENSYYEFIGDKPENQLPEDVEEIKMIDSDGIVYYENTEQKLCEYNSKKSNKATIIEDTNLDIHMKNLKVLKSKDKKKVIFQTEPNNELIEINGMTSDRLGIEYQENNIIYLKEEGKEPIKLSEDGKVYGITDENDIIYNDNGKLIILNNNNEKKVITDEHLINILFDNTYNTLLYSIKNKEKNETLYVWDIKNNKSSKIIELENGISYIEGYTLKMLSKSRITFSIFNLKGNKLSINVADLNGNITEIISGDNHELQALSASQYKNDVEDNKLEFNKIYYTKKEEMKKNKSKNEVLYCYDINSKTITQICENVKNQLVYPDRIYCINQTEDNYEVVEIMNNNSKKIIAHRDKYSKTGTNLPVIIGDGIFDIRDNAIYKDDDLIVDNIDIDKIVYDENIIYFKKDNKLNIITKDGKIKEILNDTSKVKNMYSINKDLSDIVK